MSVTSGTGGRKRAHWVAPPLGIDEEAMPGWVAERWAGWVAVEPGLAACPDPATLAEWRRVADPALVNQVLLGLGRLAAVDGADDLDAARVLAWLLLPAAEKVRSGLRQLGARVGHLVAAQLWIEVRHVPWQRCHKVAARIRFRLREGVLRDYGLPTLRCRGAAPEIPSPVATVEPEEAVGWHRGDDGEPDRPQVRRPPVAGEPSWGAAELLVDLVGWARAEQVLTAEDVELLVCLVAALRAVEDVGGRVRDSGADGLNNAAAVAVVAARLGVCERTVRRRTARCVRVLAAVAGRFFDTVAA